MTTRSPRVLTVLEQPLYKALERLARIEHVSLSQKVRDLVKEALETNEDAMLLQFAESREKTFRRSQSLSHEQAWGRSLAGAAKPRAKSSTT